MIIIKKEIEFKENKLEVEFFFLYQYNKSHKLALARIHFLIKFSSIKNTEKINSSFQIIKILEK